MLKLLTLLALVLTAVSTAHAQDTTPSPATEFVSLFDGMSLNGWEGDKRSWRVEDGVLIGQTTTDLTTTKNTFLKSR